MSSIISITNSIQLKKRVETYERVLLALEAKETLKNTFDSACVALSATLRIFQQYLKCETDPEIFEGARNQIVAMFDSKAADFQQMKFKIPNNTVNPSFDIKGGENDK
jgi:hypothetical protein